MSSPDGNNSSFIQSIFSSLSLYVPSLNQFYGGLYALFLMVEEYIFTQSFNALMQFKDWFVFDDDDDDDDGYDCIEDFDSDDRRKKKKR